eukprot:767016-Hanusia_phi.AAC.6
MLLLLLLLLLSSTSSPPLTTTAILLLLLLLVLLLLLLLLLSFSSYYYCYYSNFPPLPPPIFTHINHLWSFMFHDMISLLLLLSIACCLASMHQFVRCPSLGQEVHGLLQSASDSQGRRRSARIGKSSAGAHLCSATSRALLSACTWRFLSAWESRGEGGNGGQESGGEERGGRREEGGERREEGGGVWERAGGEGSRGAGEGKGEERRGEEREKRKGEALTCISAVRRLEERR